MTILSHSFFYGFVSFKILPETGSSISLLLADTLLLCEASSTGGNVRVRDNVTL